MACFMAINTIQLCMTKIQNGGKILHFNVNNLMVSIFCVNIISTYLIIYIYFQSFHGCVLRRHWLIEKAFQIASLNLDKLTDVSKMNSRDSTLFHLIMITHLLQYHVHLWFTQNSNNTIISK